MFRQEVVGRFRQGPWQPPLLSRPVSGHALAILFAGSAALLVVFATTFEFALKERVKGYLTPAGGWTGVTTHSFGVVRRRLVREGDFVEAGDVLFELASKDGLTRAVTVNDKVLEEIQGLRRTMQGKQALVRRRHDNAIALLELEDERNKRELAQANKEVDALQSLVAIARDRQRAGLRLLDSHMLSASAFQALEEAVYEGALALSQGHRHVERLGSAIAAHQRQAERLALETQQELLAVEEALRRLGVEEARARGFGSARILASRRGSVASVRVDVGDEVQPGQVLLDILPHAAPLQAKLFAHSAAAGFVQVGQEVRLYIDAFSYERYGAPVGEVRAISETTLPPGESGIAHLLVAPAEPIFRIEVGFPNGIQAPLPQDVALRPGMLVEAELVRDYNTLVDWAMAPLQGAARRL